MDERSLPTPIPTLTESQLWDVFEGLPPARYMTSDLYQRYVQWAEARGVAPVNLVAFGSALGRTKKLDRKEIKGRGSWFIPEMIWRSPLEGRE